MLLTAHRVCSSGGQEGINAFCHLHGSHDWVGPPPPGVPDSNPGRRVNETIVIAPGGNRVRSYLDIIAPDGTPTTELLAAVDEFVRSTHVQPLPWVMTIGRCTIRFGIEPGLEDRLGREFQELLGATLAVRTPA